MKYTRYDSDDEDRDTVETRKSVKTAEKAMKQRFFINAKEQRQFQEMEGQGKIRKEVLDFEEKDHREITETADEIEAKEATKKAAAVQKAAEEEEIKSAKNEKEKKEVV